MASATRRAKRANKNNMENEINLEGVIERLSTAVETLDRFAQEAVSDNEDQVLRARFTQAIILAGTSLEILGGLSAQAKAAVAAQSVNPETSENNG